MDAVTVYDEISLLDLLNLSRESVERSNWVCHHVDVSGTAAQTVNTSELPNDRQSMSGIRLLTEAESIEQIFEGDFSAYTETSKQPWLTLRNIRGMYFVVISDDEVFMAVLRTQFVDVRNSPDDVGYFVA